MSEVRARIRPIIVQFLRIVECLKCGPSAMDNTSLIARFMGPTWGPPGADRTQVDPMFAPWTLLSGVERISVINSLGNAGVFVWNSLVMI